MIIALIISIILIDQLTKWLICRGLDFNAAITVIPGFFDIRKVFNDGAAWGMLSGQRFILVGVSVLMLFVLWFNRKEIFNSSLGSRIGAGLLVGGIIGNLIDRLKFGYVIDFLDFHCSFYTFPTFNVADSAICAGVFLFVVFEFLKSKKEKS